MVFAYTLIGDNMICPKCHKVYDDGSLYCEHCGTRLVSEKNKGKQETPIERFSTKVKTSKPKTETNEKVKYKEVNMNDNKMDILILQNKELIKQNNRIIELLEKLTR